MVRWSYTSKMDLLKIYSYISNDSVFYAKKVVNDIVDKSEYLDSFPNLGKVVEEIGDEELREILVYSYRMIYRIVEDGINVVAIVHGKRNLTTDMLDEKL